MPESTQELVSLEMGYTHEEFKRTLEFFMDGQPYTVSGTQVNIPGPGRNVCISLGPQNERRIGPTIRLPKTPVEIVFSGFSEADRKRFMQRFEMIFRRGGG